MSDDFITQAIRYAKSLPTPDEEAFARQYAVHLLGASEPDAERVLPSRAPVIRAMVADLRDRALTGR